MIKPSKKLRSGYTTGSCATAATRGALYMAIAGIKLDKGKILTPKGIELNLELLDHEMDINMGKCAVRKDGGDDPDATHKALVYAMAVVYEGEEDTLEITGGVGVGYVTKPGLACDIGQPAINPVPRKMITEQVQQVKDELGFHGRVFLEISLPDGVKIAEHTFNPRLGIVGGVSILGTSGIVEPMSERALIDTIKVEMSVRHAEGRAGVVITPGNYGWKFIKEKTNISENFSVQSSNFVGDALDYAKEVGFKRIILVGHLGKFIKVSGGIFNTHSSLGDHRIELLKYHVDKTIGRKDLQDRINEAVMVDEAVSILKEENLDQIVMDSVANDIVKQVIARIGKGIDVGVMVFSNKYGLLAQTEKVIEIIKEMEK